MASTERSTTLKNFIILVTVFLILAMAVYNSITDNTEMNEHHEFFTKMETFSKEVRKFMNRGGRNTNTMGYELCKDLNETRENLNQPTIDCEIRYNRGE